VSRITRSRRKSRAGILGPTRRTRDRSSDDQQRGDMALTPLEMAAPDIDKLPDAEKEAEIAG
jgi:hypothetical protein